MFQLTKNNHFVFGVNNTPYSMRKTYSDRFYSSFGKCAREPKGFFEEGILAAKEIIELAKSVNKKPLLFYSGGQDCEAMVKMFTEASSEKIDIFNIRYLDDNNDIVNDFDQCDVEIFKKENIDKVNFHQESINLLKECNTDKLKTLALNSNCRFIYMMPIADALISKSNDGWVPVLGNADVLFLNEGNTWNYVELEYMMPWYYATINNNITAIPGFFQWSPEFIMSFIKIPEVKQCCTGKLPGKINTRSTKYWVYHTQLGIRNRFKGDGFENIRNLKVIRDIDKQLQQVVHYDIHSAQRFKYNELVELLTK